ncbi:MAG: hypothetical protein WC277_04955 [Bacilli bacterium]|jgi:hypothetical protein
MPENTPTGTPTRSAAGTFKAERAPGDALTREELAGMLSDVLKNLHARVTATRFKAKAADPEQMAIVRALVQASQTLNTVIKDSNEADFERRLAALEEAKR